MAREGSQSPLYRALLFDLDGTLADTDALHLPTWADVLAPHGVSVDEEFYRERISGRTNPEVVADILPDLSRAEAEEMAFAKESDFRERAADLEPLAGLLDFISAARAEGRGVALVTNAPRENVAAVLKALGLEDAFHPVVVADDVGVGKPDPAPYEAALGALGVPAEEAVAFEDSTSGITSAVAAGIPTVGVASTQRPAKLEGAGAFAVVDDFTDPDLPALVGLSRAGGL